MATRFKSRHRSKLFMMMVVMMLTMAALANIAAADDTTRPIVVGTHGVVAANHPLASMAGMRILMDGGNAIDATIATAAALGVVEPHNSGLGGDGFVLIYIAETDEIHLLNFSGRAPAALSADHFGDRITGGPISTIVPGSPAGWHAIWSRFGTKHLSELFASAIRLAEDGHPLTSNSADFHNRVHGAFLDYDMAGSLAWWDGALLPPKTGDMVRNPKLGATYRRLAKEGLPSFYTGPIADEMIAFIQRHGGVMTKQDLLDYEVIWEEPLRVNYRGYDVYVPPLNSSGGLAVLQILNIVEGFDLASMGVNTPEYVHTMLEAFKLAGADRQEWSGDPEFLGVDVPYDRLLSDDYANERRALIDPDFAAVNVDAGVPRRSTTHISIVDKDGNMVSMTTTLGASWWRGNAPIAGETGIALNDAVNWFDLDPNSPNLVAGGKRPRWNMTPTLITKDGSPIMVLGTPGADSIWQTLPQVITKIIDFDMNIQEAIESPRFRWLLSGANTGIETRIDADIRAQLEERGHVFTLYGDWTDSVGGVNAILVNPDTGAIMGGADPRRDGYVIGW